MVSYGLRCRAACPSNAPPDKMKTNTRSSSPCHRSSLFVSCRWRALTPVSFRRLSCACLSEGSSGLSTCCPCPRPPASPRSSLVFHHAFPSAGPLRPFACLVASCVLLSYYCLSCSSILAAAAPLSSPAVSTTVLSSLSLAFFLQTAPVVSAGGSGGDAAGIVVYSNSGGESEGQAGAEAAAAGGFEEEEEEGVGEERNNWAVIVSTSRYWQNYRHTANALTIYFTVKHLGVPDSRIILMVADDHACTARNPFPGQIFNSPRRSFNLYGVTAPKAATVRQRRFAFEEAARAAAARKARRRPGAIDLEVVFERHLRKISSFFTSSSSSASPAPHRSPPSSSSSASRSILLSESLGEDVEVDYRGEEVHVQALLRLLTGRHAAETPRGQRLLSDSRSHVMVYLTGHGGENFLKFQDWEEVGAIDLADAVAQMHQQQRYKRLLLIAETCQGSTLLDSVYSPNVLGMASSKLEESSYSHHADTALGVSVVDRWTYFTWQFFRKHVFRRRKRRGSRRNSRAARGDIGRKEWYRDSSDDEDGEETGDEADDRDEGDEEDEASEFSREEEAEEVDSNYFRHDRERTDRRWRTDETQRQKRKKKRSGQKPRRAKTVADLFQSYSFEKLMSTATTRTDLFDKPLEETGLDEFFSAATGVVTPTLTPYWLPSPAEAKEKQQQHRRRQRKSQRQLEEDLWREQRRSHNSYPVFDVLPYYRESFLCLLCEAGRAPGARGVLQGQQQEEEEQRGEEEQQEEEESKGRVENSVCGSRGERASAAGETEGNTACSRAYRSNTGSNSSGGRMSSQESDYDGGNRGQQQQRHWLYAFPEPFRAGAAGATAFLAAAAASLLLQLV